MKTKYITTKIIASGILFSLLGIQAFCQQDNLEGNWEGMFMEQFKLEILFLSNENKNLSGNIKMYDGSTMIQDDELIEIEYDKQKISFMIPAKETAFEGKLNDNLSQFGGDFIFPDGSRHPVLVARKGPGNQVKGSSSVKSSNILTETFSPAQLKEDLIFLRGHLSETHPQYHLYASEETYDALYTDIMQSLGRELTIGEYFNLISPVVSKIGCSHTGIRLPESYIKAQQGNNHYFPFKIFVRNEKAWILGSMDDQEYILPGSEILRINHIPMDNIIARLLSFIPAEGYNKTTKCFEINRDFGSYFNLANNSEQFQIEYKEPAKNKILSVDVNAIPFESYTSGTKSVIREFPIIHSFNKEKSIAVMEIRSFAMPDVNEFLRIIDSTFLEIQKANINNLVIDLRGNQGGHPIFAAILYSYLTSEEFTYFQLNDDVPEFKPLYESMEPAANNFEGNCYVLVDGGCLSTTGHLISLLRYHERAVFIGEEPGSWFYCNDNSIQYELPNTRIMVNIPRTTFMTDVKGYKMRDSFKVDYPLITNIEDRLPHHDPWMEFTLNLISH